ncbi:MAG: GAF domain-containing protein [Armatimonadetes bacterium]|nr:GAF domain-containing protein [Armatimonadota bacterium]
MAEHANGHGEGDVDPARQAGQLQQEVARLRNEVDRLNNELAARVDTKDKEQMTLAEGTLFISEVEVRKAIARQLRNGSRLLQASKCVYLLHDGKNELVAQRPALGLEEEELALFRTTVGRGISGEVFRTRKAARIDRIADDPRSGEEPLARIGAVNGIAVPLLLQIRDEENRVIDSRAIGVLWVLNSRGGGFTADDERLLTVFARQVAAVVGNAKFLEELLGQNQQMISTFENLPAGILFVGEDDRIRLVNNAARSLFKLPEGRGVGEAYYRAIEHNRTCETLNACMRENEDKGAEVPFEIEGEERIYQIQAARVRGGSDDLNGVVAVFDDVTEVHRLDRMKQEFVQTFSSELLGPVASISGFSAMLRRTAEELPVPMRGEIHSIISAECDRLRRHIQDLLNVPRVEQGIRPHLSLERFDFAAMVKRVIDREAPLNTLHHFHFEAQPDLPRVNGDEPRLEGVAYNLVVNAIRYSPDGGNITVKVYTQDNTVRVSVTDQGVGIPAEQREEVFRKFARVKRADERVRAGRGIGLFISRFFVEAHGGQVGVESEEGQGSTFWFWVPILGPAAIIER